MSSAAKLAANQANAKHSTGPVTEAGKAITARNATSHGLTSKQIVLPGENIEEFEALKASLTDIYGPKTDLEKSLLDEFAACNWRLNRARRVETAFLSKLAEGSPDPSIAIAVAFLEKPAEIQRMLRYVTAIERAYYRALNVLNKTIKARLEAEYRLEIQLSAQEYLAKKQQRRSTSNLGSFCTTGSDGPQESAVPSEIQTTQPQPLYKKAAA